MCRKRRPQSSLEVTSPPLQRKKEVNWKQWLDKLKRQLQTRSTKFICPCLSKVNPAIITFSNNESVGSSSGVDGDQYLDDISSNDKFSYSNSSEVRTAPEHQAAMLAGCDHCYMYFMVPNNDLSCPRCTRLLFDVRSRIQN